MKRIVQIGLLGLVGTALLAVILANTSTVLAKPNAQATATSAVTATAPITAAATVTATAAAATTPIPTPHMEAAREYCAEQGGTVTVRYPAFNLDAPQSEWVRLGFPHEFCTFLTEADSTGFRAPVEIGLDTLYADGPTLAVLAYLEPVAPPPSSGGIPATEYCTQVGGTNTWGGQGNDGLGGWVTDNPETASNLQVASMCVFPDTSVIDSWGLVNKAHGNVSGVDLAQLVRYQPSELPHVFVSARSPQQPADVAVDTTLTEADNGSDVTLSVGDIVRVELPSNPSTGFSWTVTTDDETVLAPVGEPKFELGTGAPRPGAGGTQTFTFRAIAAGTTTLTLVYARPWETTTTPTPENTWTVEVTVE